MLFNSYEFIFLFLPIVFLGFYLIASSSHRLAALWLGIASIVFYAVWDTRFVLLLLVSIAFNYGAGFWIGLHRAVNANKHAKRTLIAAIAVNLSLLGYFKYANFFVVSGNQLFGIHIPALDIILPLGISFFTFTQIAFLVDVYRGIAREYSFIHYLLFVTYFPHLIAGPVLHHKQMMPQFASPKTFKPNSESIAVGLTLFSLGLFKKVILADQFALYANPVFSTAASGAQPMMLEAWVGALAYTLQLYFDFSGYSDMAIGLSRMFNIKLPLNFNSPYKATSIIEFWRRWHMTLSAFLRDYLYFPLGGNRKGPLRRHINLMTTMLLGGLWHGAGWNFVLWGGLHGIYLVVNHIWRKLNDDGHAASGRLIQLSGALLTFTAVVVAWVPFRANDFNTTLALLRGMAGLNGISLPTSLVPHIGSLFTNVNSFGGVMPLTALPVYEVAMWLSAGLMIIWLLPNTQEWMANFEPAWDDVIVRSRLAWKPSRRHAIFTGVLLCVSLLSLNRESPFLYFQF